MPMTTGSISRCWRKNEEWSQKIYNVKKEEEIFFSHKYLDWACCQIQSCAGVDLYPISAPGRRDSSLPQCHSRATGSQVDKIISQMGPCSQGEQRHYQAFRSRRISSGGKQIGSSLLLSNQRSIKTGQSTIKTSLQKVCLLCDAGRCHIPVQFLVWQIQYKPL